MRNSLESHVDKGYLSSQYHDLSVGYSMIQCGFNKFQKIYIFLSCIHYHTLKLQIGNIVNNY
jgi:hypothetical protein